MRLLPNDSSEQPYTFDSAQMHPAQMHNAEMQKKNTLWPTQAPLHGGIVEVCLAGLPCTSLRAGVEGGVM